MSYPEGDKRLFKIDLIKQLKGNYSLLPFFLLAGFGLIAGSFTMIRTIIRSPDVIVNKKEHKKPWERLQENKNYRYFHIGNSNENGNDDEKPKLD